MSENNEKMSTSDLGFVAMGRAAARQTTEAEVQAGVDATMRGVIGDRYSATINRPPAETVTVANAPKVVTAGERSGWQEEKPLKSPMPKGSFIESVVGGMIDAHLGPAQAKPKAGDRDGEC